MLKRTFSTVLLRVVVPFLFRTIRKSKWYKHPDVAWLAEDELQADALGDITTKNNMLSVYVVEDNKSDLDRTIGAYAATRDHLSNLDFALIDLKILDDLGIKFEQTVGETLDTGVNSRHYDLVELTATKLLLLAKAIRESGSPERYTAKRVLKLLVQSVADGLIDAEVLNKKNPELMRKVEQYMSS